MAFDIRSREDLVATLKELRFQTIMKTHTSDCERELIEGLSLSSKPLSVDRIMGGSLVDAHELQFNIIDQLDYTREQLARASHENEERDQLIRQIQSMPPEYRWILKAKYIDLQTDADFCRDVGLASRAYYKFLSKAVDLLFEYINTDQ